MVPFTGWTVAGIVVACFLILLKRRNTAENPKELPLPPGPPKLPIFGNLFHMKNSEMWLSYSAMAQKYGMSVVPVSIFVELTSSSKAMSCI